MGEDLIKWYAAGKLTGILLWDRWFTNYQEAYAYWKTRRPWEKMEDPEAAFKKDLNAARIFDSSLDLVTYCRKGLKIQLNPKLLGKAINNRDPEWDKLQ